MTRFSAEFAMARRDSVQLQLWVNRVQDPAPTAAYVYVQVPTADALYATRT